MSIWLASYKVRKPSVNYVKELIRQRKYMSEIQTDSQSKIKDKRLEMRIQENDYPDLSFDEDDSTEKYYHTMKDTVGNESIDIETSLMQLAEGKGRSSFNILHVNDDALVCDLLAFQRDRQKKKRVSSGQKLTRKTG